MKIKMSKIFLALMLLFIGSFFSAATAQKIEVTGKVTDKATSSPLPGATVMILHPKDSTFYKFGITNSTGDFSIKGTEAGIYIFQISFIRQHIKSFQ